MVAFAELVTPIGQFECLVNEQDEAALFGKFTSELYDTTSLEIEIVRVDVEAFALTWVKVFLGKLQEEGGAPDAPWSAHSYHAIAPVDVVHQRTPDGSIEVLHEKCVCSVECFHNRFPGFKFAHYATMIADFG